MTVAQDKRWCPVAPEAAGVYAGCIAGIAIRHITVFYTSTTDDKSSKCVQIGMYTDYSRLSSKGAPQGVLPGACNADDSGTVYAVMSPSPLEHQERVQAALAEWPPAPTSTWWSTTSSKWIKPVPVCVQNDAL